VGGGQTVGVPSAPKTAILKNIGTEPVTFIDIEATGDFRQENNCPAVIAAGASCEIAVVFQPAAPGIQSGSISIGDLLGNSPQTQSLAGLGLPAE
jgi:hypothetical protein